MILILGLVILVFSAILHEIMHGWVANKLGDPTARLMGRLTLNPLPHIDPVMSIIIPTLLVLSHSPILFGAAKPVPVNPMHFKDPRKDMAIVALSGPLTNFAIALVAAGLAHLFYAGFISEFLYLVVFYNLMLGFINLIPVPPLDGSKVFSIILPENLARSYMSIEYFGLFLLFILLSFPIGPFSLGDFLGNLIYSSLHLLGF